MNEITVIPLTNEALQAVETPIVTFEQPFQERPSRLERQLDAFHDSTACVLLTDTWPDAQHAPIPRFELIRAVSGVGKPISPTDVVVWPETAIYKTEVAKLHEIDERVVYRPHAHFFGRFRDNIPGHWSSECSLMSEAGIVVADRGVYNYGEAAPVLALCEQSLRVSGILVIDHLTQVHSEALQSWQLQSEKSKELIVVLCGASAEAAQSAKMAADLVIDAPDCAPSDAVNRAIEQARGEYIVLVDPMAVSLRDRLQVQCDLAVDVSVLSAQQDSELMLHTHSWMSGKPDRIEFSMMFHRRVFERTGGMYPTLPVGFVYDKFLQAQRECHALSFALLREQLLGSIAYPKPYGETYSQHVYNDVFRRRMVEDREHNAWSLRSRR